MLVVYSCERKNEGPGTFTCPEFLRAAVEARRREFVERTLPDPGVFLLFLDLTVPDCSVLNDVGNRQNAKKVLADGIGVPV